jgi:hypothetical protein
MMNKVFGKLGPGIGIPLVILIIVVLALIFVFSGWVVKTIEMVLLIAILAWYFSGYQLVPRNQIGIKYWFQTMVPEGMNPEDIGNATLFSRYGFCKSGLQWVARLPGCGIHKIPKTRFNVGYDPRAVISKKTTGTGSDQENYGKQMIIVSGTIYCEFGKNAASVIKAVERGTPVTEEGLKDKTDDLIDDAFRTAIGGMDWSRATEAAGRKEIADNVKGSTQDANSYFSLGGINTDNIDVRIRATDLQSEELKKAMAKPDIERIEAAGAQYEAQRVLREASIIAQIRESLVKAGFAGDVDEISHKVFELQTAKDLQLESKMSVVRLVRFQTDGSSKGSIPAAIVEGLTAFTEGKDLLGGGTGKGPGDSGVKPEKGGGEKKEGKEKTKRLPTPKNLDEAMKQAREASQNIAKRRSSGWTNDNTEEEEEEE